MESENDKENRTRKVKPEELGAETFVTNFMECRVEFPFSSHEESVMHCLLKHWLFILKEISEILRHPLGLGYQGPTVCYYLVCKEAHT